MKIQVAEKLKPLYTDTVRYKGLKGGRGSGKSWAIVDYILYRMVQDQSLNTVALREVLKSIAKSSKKLLEDRIDHHNLYDYFEIQQSIIKCKKGKGEIIFQGLQDHTADSIKSLEGFDIAFVEESQTISQHSLDLLIPTIRKDDSELLFSWNPRSRVDAIEKLFKDKANSLLIHINYDENPFCPQVLIDEAEEMKAKDPENYAHIYKGGYVDSTGKNLFTYQDIDNAMNRNGDDSGAITIGLDVARYGNDSSVIVIRKGLHVTNIITRDQQSITETADWAATQCSIHRADGIIVDTIGIGAGVHDMLINQGFFSIDGNFGMKATDNDTYMNKRAESYFKLADAIKRGLSLPKDDELMEELLSIEYSFNESGKARIEPKEKIKELLGRSPDKADALALTFFTTIHRQAADSYMDDNYTAPNLI